MPPVDDSLLTDDDDAVDNDIELDDESLDSDADEEMSGEDEDESDEDSEELDDDEDEDADDDDEPDRPLTKREADLQRQLQQFEQQQQQAKNKAYWEDIEGQASDYFEWKADQIDEEKHKYLDPDAYAREQNRILKNDIRTWYKDFFASIDQARQKQNLERMRPVYIARLATHYELTTQQAQELSEYPDNLVQREAQKMYQRNQERARNTNTKTQKKRSTAKTELLGKVPPSGSGRAPATRLKAGSDAHLKKLLGY